MTTTNKVLSQPAAGDLNWYVPLNDNAGYIDAALGSFATITDTYGIVTLSTSQFRCMGLKSTELEFTADVTYVIPSGVGGQWIVKNQSNPDGDAFNLIVKNAAGSTSVSIANGQTRTVYSDGSNVYLSNDIDIATQAQAEAGTDNTVLMTPLRTKQSITSEIATQAQAEAGTDNTVLMTPLRVEQAITSDIATQAQAQAGTDNTKLMTPLRVDQAISYSAPGVAAGLARGAIGSYGFFGTNSNPSISGGSTTAGANLRYASLWTKHTSFGDYTVIDIATVNPSGTWRLMGETFYSGQDTQTSLFLRIS